MNYPHFGRSMEILEQRRLIERTDKAMNELRTRREIIDRDVATPFPEDSPEVQLLRNHGVLDTILFKLTDPVDVSAAYNTCGAFQEVLERRMAMQIKEKALHIAFNTLFKKAYSRGSKDLKDLLNLRVANKSMKKVVDKYLFETPFLKENFESNDDFKFCSSKPLQVLELKLETVDQVKRALSVLSATSDKKSFQRDLVVWEQPGQGEGSLSEFRAVVKELLEKFGRAIWGFSYVPVDDDSVADIYERSCNWANLMPTLKSLNIITRFYNVDDLEKQAVTRRIEQCPFPSIPSLRVCVVGSGLNQVHETILAAAIQANPWITRTKFYPNSPVGFTTLPTSFKPDNLSIFTESIPLSLTKSSWPLRKLSLSTGMKEESISPAVLFPVLERFKETLIHLDIRGVALRNEGNDRVVTYLDLHHLITFSVQLSNCFHKLDFMLPMQSLEMLSIVCKHEDMTFFYLDQTEMIQFKGLLHHMEYSNIGNVFRYLKQLEVFNVFPFQQHIRIEYNRDRELDLMKLNDNCKNF